MLEEYKMCIMIARLRLMGCCETVRLKWGSGHGTQQGTSEYVPTLGTEVPLILVTTGGSII